MLTYPHERTRPARSPILLQWLALVERHGSQTAALEAIIESHTAHERLKRAVRAMGMDPVALSSDSHAASLGPQYARRTRA